MTDKIQEQIEDKVIDCINTGAAGRLVIVKPDKNSPGVDLVVQRRGKYKEREFYLKINTLVGPTQNIKFIVDFLEKSFRENENFYLLFVYFNEVSQKIADHIWLIPSSFFRDAAQVVMSPEGERLLRFEGDLDFRNQNAYSRFLINTIELGELLLDALEIGGGVVFKNLEFTKKRSVNLENLKYFLCEARKNTYAANAVGAENPKLSGSVQLEFQKGDYFYMDVRFSGEKRFTGMEVIYQESKPIWAMNYVGDQIGILETSFLREALHKLSEKCRLGEAVEYKKREFKYKNTGEGSIKEFSGEEEIFSGEKSIYRLDYQGGILLEEI